MKYRYLSILLILLILSVGAVSAQEDCASDDIIAIEQDDVILSASEFVIDDANYDDFFNSENGAILDNSNISDGDIIKLGNISNKDFTIDKNLEITSNSLNDVLNNVSFTFMPGSDYSTIQNLNFESSDAQKSTISVINTTDISIVENNIDVTGAEDSGDFYAIYAEFGDNLIVETNVITYTGKSNGTAINNAVYVSGSESISFEANNLTVNVPGGDMDWTSGFGKTEGIVFDNCDNLIFIDNSVNVKSNESAGSNPTVYGVHIAGSDGVYVSGNILNLSASVDYVYAFKVDGDNFYVENNVFNVVSDNNYACGIEVGTPAIGVIENNEITVEAPASAYGIYAADWYASGCSAEIYNNLMDINANTLFGISLYGVDEASISGNDIDAYGNYTTGIASNAKTLTVSSNDMLLNASNEGTPLGYDSLGIESVGVHIISDDASITNNAIRTTGNFTVNTSGSGNVADNYLVADVLMGDESVNATDATLVENNIPANESNYNLTNDTFFLFFNEDGFLRDGISPESLTFIGEFSDVALWMTIDRPVKLLSDNAVLNDMSFSITSDNVTINGFTFISKSLAEIISIDESDNAAIINNNFTFTGLSDDNNVVIGISGSDNALIENNTIVFGVKTDETHINNVINAENSDNLIISSNNITASMPSRSIDSGEVYSTGVSLKDCDEAVLSDNTIEIKSNEFKNLYDTIYAMQVSGNNVNISNNRLGAIEAPCGYGLVITGRNFLINDNTIYTGKDKYYACGIDVESNSNGKIENNMITTAGIYSYGIYTANQTGNVRANIFDNTIFSTGFSVFGMSLSGSQASVRNNIISAEGNFTTGIASAISKITINGNTIVANASNEGIPLSYDPMGIETAGIHIASGNATVTKNSITSNSKYAVDMNGTGTVKNNEIYADFLTGDFAVGYSQGDDIIVNSNTPKMNLDYKLTNDTFFIYFDDEGRLREQIDTEKLTFIGEFSNLVDKIIVEDPITFLSDNATLNDIGMEILSGNVTVDGFNFISKSLAQVISVNESDKVSVINSNFTVTGVNDDNNAVIDISDSGNILIDNNMIKFSVKTDETHINRVINALNSDALVISNNTVAALMPARSVDWTSGVVYSAGIVLKDCDGAVLSDNIIGVKSNGEKNDYDTIYAVQITGDNAKININYIGAVEAPYGYGLVISGKNFLVDNNLIYAGENMSYACGIDVESNSNGKIENNMIMTSGISSYGIYTANWAGDVKANILNNEIYSSGNSVFGMSLSGSQASVENNEITTEGNFTTGIASVIGKITIDKNTIVANASNKGTPLGYDSMGIETTGVHIVSGNAVVTNNDIETTGSYTANVTNTASTVAFNHLIAKKLQGDWSVYFTGKASVYNNTPVNLDVSLNTNDLKLYYRNGSRFVVSLTTHTGAPIANKTIILTLNGVNYTRTTKADGTASIAINLNSGNYKIITTYNPGNGQKSISNTNNIKVLSTISGNDLVKVFRNASQYYAKFVDGKGSPLKNGTMVTFNINGVMYERRTNEKGVAKLNINLEQGTYILTAINPVNGEMHTNKVTVKPSIVNNRDLVKYYKNASQYVVTLIGANGKAVGAGEVVTFNINGIFYERKTDASGHAKLNINLQPGDYIITAEYNGCKVSNKIKVLPVLFGKDLVKKYGTSDQFRVSLIDGQGKPYPNQKITFNIHGLFYERITDSDGYASLNIRLGAAVDTYIITSTYDGTSIANKITIVP